MVDKYGRQVRQAGSATVVNADFQASGAGGVEDFLYFHVGFQMISQAGKIGLVEKLFFFLAVGVEQRPQGFAYAIGFFCPSRFL